LIVFLPVGMNLEGSAIAVPYNILEVDVPGVAGAASKIFSEQKLDCSKSCHKARR
jgi:hypothetical protein